MVERTKVEVVQEYQSMNPNLCLRGNVFSGKGEGEKFIRLPWVRKQLAEKVGFTPYPGTLNVKLESGAELKSLVEAKAIEISPHPGFCRGRCFQAYLMDDVKCAIVIPEISDYDENMLEVIAPINLRERLLLKDGDAVRIKIIVP